MTGEQNPGTGPKRFLPRIGSPGYHVMLICVAIFILGPLGGISAAFMNFSIGFFIGGQVLAGILGSTVTLPYGPEGKHGARSEERRVGKGGWYGREWEDGLEMEL